MNQGSEGLWVHSLHLDLLLLRLSHVAGEHRSKVVRHSTQDQSAMKKTQWITYISLHVYGRSIYADYFERLVNQP